MTDRFARPEGMTGPCDVEGGLYCGGTWRGTINHLDYIQGMGFDAVMISPVVENVEGRVSYGEAYHGYWQTDLYSLNSHFGTRQDLLDLSDALHSRGMYLMLDVVVNNMAYILNGSSIDSVDYSILNPFDSQDYFHDYCQMEYADHDVAQRCWIGDDTVALPDLNTPDSTVEKMLGQWIQEMVSNYSVDGLRVDAAKHVNEAFLPSLGEAAGIFMTGEVYSNSTDYICMYQNKYISSVPNYPVYYGILDAFTAGKTQALEDQMAVMKDSCSDVTALLTFSENHDVKRIASFIDDMALAKNILTFTLLFDGIPIIYQGQEQHYTGKHDPMNRKPLWWSSYDTNAPLYQLTATLNTLRRHAIELDPSYLSTLSYSVYTGGSEIVVRKGQEGRQVIMVLSSQGSQGGAYNLTLPASYGLGVTAMDVLNCVNYTVAMEVGVKGDLVVEMDRGQPRVLFPVDMLEGSGLCGFPKRNASSSGLKKEGQGSAASRPDSGARWLGCFVAVVGVLVSLW
ncbi:hypothetical protein PHISP_05323 [Aspergillus sp. HF37]|nr:hypothetical protein PHISP_05323 [Aspergillus sp. HF37]